MEVPRLPSADDADDEGVVDGSQTTSIFATASRKDNDRLTPLSCHSPLYSESSGFLRAS